MRTVRTTTVAKVNGPSKVDGPSESGRSRVKVDGLLTRSGRSFKIEYSGSESSREIVMRPRGGVPLVKGLYPIPCLELTLTIN